MIDLSVHTELDNNYGSCYYKGTPVCVKFVLNPESGDHECVPAEGEFQQLKDEMTGLSPENEHFLPYINNPK